MTGYGGRSGRSDQEHFCKKKGVPAHSFKNTSSRAARGQGLGDKYAFPVEKDSWAGKRGSEAAPRLSSGHQLLSSG